MCIAHTRAGEVARGRRGGPVGGAVGSRGMCGIAGFLAKRADGPVASEVLGRMLTGLRTRGPDSTGLGLYEPATNGHVTVRVWCGDDADAADGARDRARAAYGIDEFDFDSGVLRFRVDGAVAVADICREVEGADATVEVFSVGRSLQIYKHVMDGTELARAYGLAGSPGRHGVGHTRLATESRVDVQHAHPFWARPFADICVVHNGHITNYHKLRRLYEMRGHRFFTGNDSELLALYLAHRLEEGATIQEAMEASIADLDGSFSYLLATADGLGMCRDRVGSMPGIIAETDDWVAVASESIAVHQAFGEAAEQASFRELGVGRAVMWTL
jgi:methylamine---glutamate N-methyltransferase subunit A